jgi:hypothetical protein
LRPGSSCNAKVRARNVVALSSLSCALGVGSDDEDAASSVGSTGIGSSYNSPRRVIPQAGKVAKDGIESEGNMPPNILQEDVAGS